MCSDVAEKTFADVHKVEGLQGIYIASQVLQSATTNIGPEHLITVITYDWGGEWKPIEPPTHDSNHQKINCNLVRELFVVSIRLDFLLMRVLLLDTGFQH